MRLVIELDLDAWAVVGACVSLALAAAIYFVTDYLANRERPEP